MADLKRLNEARSALREQANVAPHLRQGVVLPNLSPGINAPEVAAPGTVATTELLKKLEDPKFLEMRERVVAALEKANVSSGDISRIMKESGDDPVKLASIAAAAAVLTSKNPADKAKRQESAAALGVSSDAPSGGKPLESKTSEVSVEGEDASPSTQKFKEEKEDEDIKATNIAATAVVANEIASSPAGNALTGYAGNNPPLGNLKNADVSPGTSLGKAGASIMEKIFRSPAPKADVLES